MLKICRGYDVWHVWREASGTWDTRFVPDLRYVGVWRATIETRRGNPDTVIGRSLSGRFHKYGILLTRGFQLSILRKGGSPYASPITLIQRSVPPAYGDGFMKMRFVPGDTGCGSFPATLTLLKRHNRCWICIRDPFRPEHCVRMDM